MKEILKHGFIGSRWNASCKGYTVASAYAWLSPDMDKVPWAEWVWNSLSIPKHRFIAWLTVLGRLRTRDKLTFYGVLTDDQCLLC